MGFGLDLDVKVEVPKVEIPTVDVGAAMAGAVASATACASDAPGNLTKAVTGAVGAVADAASALGGTLAANVAVSFSCPTEDIPMEPHAVLEANASYAETQFQRGPIWIFIDMTAKEAAESKETLNIYSRSGNYDEFCALCDDFIANQPAPDANGNMGVAAVYLKFDDAPMSETYSLDVIPEDGEPYTVFQNIKRRCSPSRTRRSAISSTGSVEVG